MLPYLVFVPIAYLLGAVPFGFLVARARGIDIRTVGSGNIGATNVLRSVGKSWGILTLILDALKGLIPAALFPILARAAAFDIETDDIMRVACGTSVALATAAPLDGPCSLR